MNIGLFPASALGYTIFWCEDWLAPRLPEAPKLPNPSYRTRICPKFYRPKPVCQCRNESSARANQVHLPAKSIYQPSPFTSQVHLPAGFVYELKFVERIL